MVYRDKKSIVVFAFVAIVAGVPPARSAHLTARSWTKADGRKAADAAMESLPPKASGMAYVRGLVDLGGAEVSSGDDAKAKETLEAALSEVKGKGAPSTLLLALAKGLSSIGDAKAALVVDDQSADQPARAGILGVVASAAIAKNDFALARAAVREIKALDLPKESEGRRETELMVVAEALKNKGRAGDVLEALPRKPTNFMTLRTMGSMAVESCEAKQDPVIAQGITRMATSFISTKAASGSETNQRMSYASAGAILSICAGPDALSALDGVVAGKPGEARKSALREAQAYREERKVQAARVVDIASARDPAVVAAESLKAHDGGDEVRSLEAAKKAVALIDVVQPGPGWNAEMEAALDRMRAATAKELVKAARYDAALSVSERMSSTGRLPVQLDLVDEASSRSASATVVSAVKAAKATATDARVRSETFDLTIRHLADRGYAEESRDLAASAGPRWSSYAAGGAMEPSREVVQALSNDLTGRSIAMARSGDVEAAIKAIKGPAKTACADASCLEVRKASDVDVASAKAMASVVSDLLARDDLVGAVRVEAAMDPVVARQVRDEALVGISRAQRSDGMVHGALGTALRIDDRDMRFKALLPIVATASFER